MEQETKKTTKIGGKFIDNLKFGTPYEYRLNPFTGSSIEYGNVGAWWSDRDKSFRLKCNRK